MILTLKSHQSQKKKIEMKINTVLSYHNMALNLTQWAFKNLCNSL